MSNGNDWGNSGDDQVEGQEPGQQSGFGAPEQPQPGFQQPQPGFQQPQPGFQPQQDAMVQTGTPQKVKHKVENDDVIALIASFFLPGVGHILLGQTMKGVAIIAAVVLTCGLGYALNLAIVADAYFVAMCKKDRNVGDWEFFPDYNRYI